MQFCKWPIKLTFDWPFCQSNFFSLYCTLQCVCVCANVCECMCSHLYRLFYIEANFNKPLLVAYTYSLTEPGTLLHSLQLHTNKAPRYVILDPQAPPHEDKGKVSLCTCVFTDFHCLCGLLAVQNSKCHFNILCMYFYK